MPYNPFFNAKPVKVPQKSESLIDINENFGRYSSPLDDEAQLTSKDAELVTPVFLTPASFASFPGASLAVNLIWIISAQVYQPLANLSIVPVIAALLIGFFIYQQSVTEGMSVKEKNLARLIAFLNSLYLAAFALGLNIGTQPNS